jgi:hypothetical protein
VRPLAAMDGVRRPRASRRVPVIGGMIRGSPRERNTAQGARRGPQPWGLALSMTPQRCPACVPHRWSPRSSIHPRSVAVHTPLASLARSYCCTFQSRRTSEAEHHASGEGADTDDPRRQTCPKSAWWIPGTSWVKVGVTVCLYGLSAGGVTEGYAGNKCLHSQCVSSYVITGGWGVCMASYFSDGTTIGYRSWLSPWPQCAAYAHRKTRNQLRRTFTSLASIQSFHCNTVAVLGDVSHGEAGWPLRSLCFHL